jgi:hypothetical protein
LSKGHAFLGPEVKTRRGLFRHLNVIISEADNEQNYFVVPITTYRKINGEPLHGQDKSCILLGGSHPFIKHESYACYARARKMSYSEIFNGLNKGLLMRKDDMSAACVKKLQEGARASPYLPDELTYFFRYF